MSIVQKKKATSSVPTPATDYKTLFFRSDTGALASKDENGDIVNYDAAGDASGVTYTPDQPIYWTDSVDPGNVAEALDDLALRLNVVEVDLNVPTDASEVTYTPDNSIFWTDSEDPGNVDDALDDLVARVQSLEESGGGGGGDVSGPISSTDTAIAVWSGTAGDTLANSSVLIGDIYSAGGTDVALADGGTGASLADPGADRIMFWDDSAGAVTWLTAGSGLTIIGTTITASGATPDAADVTYTPANNVHWTDSEDPGNVDDALDDLSARVQSLEEVDNDNLPVQYTGSSIAFIDIPFPAEERNVVIRGKVTGTSDGDNFVARLTNDNFTTVESGAVYDWIDVRATSAGSVSQEQVTGDGEWHIARNIGNAAGEYLMFKMDIIDPSTSSNTSFNTQNTRYFPSGNFGVGYGGGAYQTEEVVNGIRLFFSTGNISSIDVEVTFV